MPEPRHAAPHVAACELYAVPDAVPCDLCAVPDAAPFRQSELLLLLRVLPSAQWWARPTPMLLLLFPGVRRSVDERLCHSTYHSSPPPFSTPPIISFTRIFRLTHINKLGPSAANAAASASTCGPTGNKSRACPTAGRDGRPGTSDGHPARSAGEQLCASEPS